MKQRRRWGREIDWDRYYVVLGDYCKEVLRREPWWTKHDTLAEEQNRQVALEAGRRPLTLALLASHLPNLRTLRIPCSSSSSHPNLEAAVAQVAIARPPVGSTHFAFTRLTSVDFTEARFAEFRRFDTIRKCRNEFTLDFVGTFAALPSMRRFAASRVTCKTSEVKRKDLLPSKITELALDAHKLKLDGWRALLEHGAGLRRCHISSTDVCHTTSYIKASSTIDVLRENASDTLETLVFHLRFDMKYALVLDSFTKLKNVSVTLTKRLEGTKLAKLLPPSVEVLELFVPRKSRKFFPEILDLVRGSRLSRLKSLWLWWLQPDDSRRKELLDFACSLRGIMCHVYRYRVRNDIDAILEGSTRVRAFESWPWPYVEWDKKRPGYTEDEVSRLQARLSDYCVD